MDPERVEAEEQPKLSVGPQGKTVDVVAIRALLLERGQALYDGPRQQLKFTNDPDADRLLNDLDRHPHAFVLGCLMSRQIKSEIAFRIPYVIASALGGFSIEALSRLSIGDLVGLMTNPRPRFPLKMSALIHSAVQKITAVYGGEASRIWAGCPSSADVVYRFLEFDGIGPKIATMAANILAREFKVPFADYYSVDVSADVHVRRVFGRLRLCALDATVDQIIYKARALNPKFPGMLDFPSWEIGRNWCRPQQPVCGACYMADVCPTANEQVIRPLPI